VGVACAVCKSFIIIVLQCFSVISNVLIFVNIDLSYQFLSIYTISILYLLVLILRHPRAAVPPAVASPGIGGKRRLPDGFRLAGASPSRYYGDFVTFLNIIVGDGESQ
jgi:hypothetical protein